MSRTRSQRFDDLVLAAMDQLQPRWERHLRDVEVAVEDVPPTPPHVLLDARLSDDPPEVPVGRLIPRRGTLQPRIVIYRWPLELRAAGVASVLGELVHSAVVEQVAELLDLPPEDVDPRYAAPEE